MQTSVLRGMHIHELRSLERKYWEHLRNTRGDEAVGLQIDIAWIQKAIQEKQEKNTEVRQ